MRDKSNFSGFASSTARRLGRPSLSSALRGFAVVGGAIAALSCAGGQTECHPETWAGTCHLIRVQKVREAEFPLPSVTLEAVYRPQPDANGQSLLPPDLRREFTALDRYEDALRTHLDAYQTPRCYINPPPPGQCQPGPMQVEVPEFDGSKADVAPANRGPKGCAQIEATSSQDKVTQAKSSTTVIAERFEFGEGVADVTPDANAPLETLAQRLKQSPNLECVGVVGAWVRGENVAVAFARARAIREQLISRGVEPERLLALTVDPPALGPSGTPEPPNPKDRRVTLSVLLDVPAAK